MNNHPPQVFVDCSHGLLSSPLTNAAGFVVAIRFSRFCQALQLIGENQMTRHMSQILTLRALLYGDLRRKTKRVFKVWRLGTPGQCCQSICSSANRRGQNVDEYHRDYRWKRLGLDSLKPGRYELQGTNQRVGKRGCSTVFRTERRSSLA